LVPEVCFPKAVSEPVDCFGIFGVGEVYYKAVGERFFLRCTNALILFFWY
jgi:hypothetical protein